MNTMYNTHNMYSMRSVYNIKPILFSTEMVRAILAEQKTVTRRLVKPTGIFEGWTIVERDEALRSPDGFGFFVSNGEKSVGTMFYTPYAKGDIMYVRETFRIESVANTPGSGRVHYKADDTRSDFSFAPERYEMMKRAQLKPGWSPSQHMPYEVARLFLRVTNVSVAKLQSITPEELRAEGIRLFVTPSECKSMFNRFGAVKDFEAKLKEFSVLWDSTIRKPAALALYGWEANPWVFVISFERIDLAMLQ